MWKDLDFLHVVSLESLDLKSCFLSNIPPLAFSKLKHVRYSNLSDNGIEMISITISHCLQMLDLSANRINNFPQMMMDSLDSIAEEHNVTLYLFKNKLHCFCDELEFMNWLKSTKERFENKYLTFCGYPGYEHTYTA